MSASHSTVQRFSAEPRERRILVRETTHNGKQEWGREKRKCPIICVSWAKRLFFLLVTLYRPVHVSKCPITLWSRLTSVWVDVFDEFAPLPSGGCIPFPTALHTEVSKLGGGSGPAPDLAAGNKTRVGQLPECRKGKEGGERPCLSMETWHQSNSSIQINWQIGELWVMHLPFIRIIILLFCPVTHPSNYPSPCLSSHPFAIFINLSM